MKSDVGLAMRWRRNLFPIVGFLALGLAGSAGADENKRFTYDALGRLTKVESGTGPNGAQSAEYTFDKAGNRVRVQVSAPGRVENGSFELPSLGSYAYNPQAPNVQFAGGAGIAVHGDAFGFPVPWHGRQVAFLQSVNNANASLTMTARNLIVGRTYQFAYAIVRRPGYATNNLNIHINGTLVQTVNAPNDQHFSAFPTPSFVATSTEATIRFESTPTMSDSATGLDAVSVERLN